jgi:glycosyltransferase involved in cell wall biosynthesis
MEGGGAEKVALNLANHWAEHGISVDLVLVRAKGVYLCQLSKHVNVIDLDSTRTMGSVWKLTKYLRRARPDVILSAMDHANLAAIFATIISLTRTKTAVSIHCAHEAYKKNSSRSNRYLPGIARFFYRFVNFRIAVSKGVAEELERTYWWRPAKFTAIHNPIGCMSAAAVKNEQVHEWLSSKISPVIVAAGRLCEVKDYPTLLRAFAIVLRRTDARLLILGEGDKRQELEMLSRELVIDSHMQLCGHVLNPSSYMAEAAVLVMSSKFEGFGNVLIEAMACGTPVVSTDCPYGPREILENGKFGKLVPVGNHVQLAEAIVKTIGEQRRSTMLKKRAGEFGVEKVAAKYWNLFNEG